MWCNLGYPITFIKPVFVASPGTYKDLPALQRASWPGGSSRCVLYRGMEIQVLGEGSWQAAYRLRGRHALVCSGRLTGQSGPWTQPPSHLCTRARTQPAALDPRTIPPLRAERL
jgi:hypothetical protein